MPPTVSPGRFDLGMGLPRLLSQVLRVGVAGAAALVVDLCTYLSLLPLLDPAAAAAAVGHVAGILVHFTVSSRVLLRPEMRHLSGVRTQADALAKFFVAGGAGMVVTTAVVFATVDRLGFHPLAGKGVAVVLSFATVFLLLKVLVLKDPASPVTPSPAGS
jgi:putative flippase GtrA